MNIDRIQYQKVFPISTYCTERIGLEASLDDNENPEEALSKLKIMVDTLHQETLSQLDQYRGTTTKIIEEQPNLSNEDKKKKQIAGFVEAITTCTSLKSLEIFTKLVERENIDELYEAYHSTKLKLQNGSI